MGIEAGFDIKAFEDFLKSIPDIFAEEIINSLSYLGLECIVKIRDRSAEASWYDHSGNLRSSVGFAIYNNGKVVMDSGFKQVLNGKEGVESGKKAIIELATKYANNQFTLVILAGMEYAEYVEAMENKDVLASTELWARGEVESRIQKALSKAEKRINELQHKFGL